MSAGTHHRWTPAENKFLRDHYSDLGVEGCAEALGMTIYQIRAHARDMGVRMRSCSGSPGAATKPWDTGIRVPGWGWL